jgi:hypothetical protein
MKKTQIFLSFLVFSFQLLLFFFAKDVVAENRPGNKYVGVLYETWFNRYQNVQPRFVFPNLPLAVGQVLWWGKPSIGFYNSNDYFVINAHADQIVSAGIDFILVDISNSNIREPDLWSGTVSLMNAYGARC